MSPGFQISALVIRNEAIFAFISRPKTRNICSMTPFHQVTKNSWIVFRYRNIEIRVLGIGQRNNLRQRQVVPRLEIGFPDELDSLVARISRIILRSFRHRFGSSRRCFASPDLYTSRSLQSANEPKCFDSRVKICLCHQPVWVFWSQFRNKRSVYLFAYCFAHYVANDVRLFTSLLVQLFQSSETKVIRGSFLLQPRT